MVTLRLFALILVAGASFAFLSFNTMLLDGAGPALADGTVTVIPLQGRSAMIIFNNRKRKDNSLNRYHTNKMRKDRDLASINKADYPHYDPPPSSRAIIDHGPIEHGTPLMPYIPRSMPPPPPPPFHPNRGSP